MGLRAVWGDFGGGMGYAFGREKGIRALDLRRVELAIACPVCGRRPSYAYSAPPRFCTDCGAALVEVGDGGAAVGVAVGADVGGGDGGAVAGVVVAGDAAAGIGDGAVARGSVGSDAAVVGSGSGVDGFGDLRGRLDGALDWGARGIAALDGGPGLGLSRRALLCLELGFAAALTAVALALRVWGLSEVPFGMHGDEAEFGLEAMRLVGGGSVGVWSDAAVGASSGNIHFMSWVFRVMGADLAGVRLTSALPGAAVVALGYALARMFFSFRVAALCALMLTFHIFFMALSRIAYQISLATALALLAMWLLALAWRSGRLWTGLLAGLAMGAGLYSFKAYLIYFAALLAAALLALAFSGGARRRWRAMALAFGAALALGAPLLWFYATTDYLETNLALSYGQRPFSPSSWVSYPGRAIDAMMLANMPIEGGGIDGIRAMPALTAGAAVFYWVGLAVAVVSVKRREYQLLLLAWAIGTLPVVIAPGQESRRYMLGMVFVLVFVSVGFNFAVGALLWALGRARRWFGGAGALPMRFAAGTVAVFTIMFASVFAAQSLGEFRDWADSGEVRWYFSSDLYRVLRFAEGAGAADEYRLYSLRYDWDFSVRRFLLPGAAGSSGSVEWGGDGTAHSGGPVARDTMFVLMDEYLGLMGALEAAHPGGRLVWEERDGDGGTVFLAYFVPGGG